MSYVHSLLLTSRLLNIVPHYQRIHAMTIMVMIILLVLLQLKRAGFHRFWLNSGIRNLLELQASKMFHFETVLTQ